MKSFLQKYSGAISVFIAGIGFGFLGLFARLGLRQDLSVGELLCWRFMMASSLLWLYALAFNRSLIRLEKKQIFISAALGFLGYAVFSSLYFYSIKGVSIALAAILLFTFPIFVNLGAHFILKQFLKPRQWLALALSFVGVVILLWGDLKISSSAAILSGLGAALTYGIYVLVSGETQKNIKPLSSSLYVMTFATLGLMAIHQPDLNRWASFTSSHLGIFLGLAIICTIAPLTLFLSGLQKMRSSQASILVMVEPLTAAVLAWLVVDEPLSPMQLAGALLVFIGMYLS